jgi:hypothetical protein
MTDVLERRHTKYQVLKVKKRAKANMGYCQIIAVRLSQ